MKRLTPIVLVLLFIAVAALGGYILARPNPLTPRVAQLELELQQAQKEIANLKAERTKLLSKPVVVPPPSVATTKDKPGDDTLADSKKHAGGPQVSMMPDLRKMMEAPGMKEMMRKQQEVQVDMTYGKLFQKLSLNDEERENLKRLLAERVSTQSETGMKLMDPSLTSEQRKAVMAEIDGQKKKSDADIRKFLNNDDDYKTYQRWEDTQTERMQLQLGGSFFDNAGAPLSDEQREQLVDIMANVRKSPGQLPDLNDPRNITPDSLSSDNITRQLQRYDTDAERVANACAAFMNPQQLEALKKMQQQMRTSTEAGMRMTGQMMGGKK